MKINFGKIVPISTVDWHGRSSSILFFNGCPFRCRYCQNHKLLESVRWIDVEKIEREIIGSEIFISAVVFSGGEPTEQPEGLLRLAKFAKNRKLNVGIQTNGYYPDILKELARKRLVDKIFLDVKTSPLEKDRYVQITNGYLDISDKISDRVIESLNIDTSGVDIEPRTTIFRSLNDSLDVARYLKENNYNIYVIQQGHPWIALDENMRKEDILSRYEMISIAQNIHKELGLNIKIRTREKGEETI